MKKSQILGIAVGAALAMGLSASAFATDGYQLIGIGQYAVGMAGAVVAAPDDPLSAAISNPAGLALMTPQAAFSAEIFNPVRKTNLGFGEIGSHTNVYGVPAIGWVAPAFGDGIVFGGGVYGTSGLGVNYLQNVPANPHLPYGGYAQAFSSITFMQMAPSIAMKVNHHLAVGATLNIAAEQASFQQTFSQYAPVIVGQTPGGVPVTSIMPVTGGLNLANPSWAYGAGFTLGMLYKVNDMVTLGLTYKSPIWFSSLNWQAGVQNQVNQTGSGVYGAPGQYSGTLNYPQQVAFGLAIRPIPQWLISVEGQWINWASTMNNFDVSGPWTAFYHGVPAGSVSSIALPMHWKNQWVANIGTQYDLTNWLQVRAGYTYGSNPISNNTIASNLIFPAIVQSAITFGATQKLGMGWTLTEAYMHEFSNTNTGPAGSSPFGGPMPVSATMYENSYGLQIGYQF